MTGASVGRAVLVVVAGAALACCRSAGPGGTTTPTSVQAGPTSPAVAGKPLPPLDISLELPSGAPQIGAPFQVTLRFATREPTRGVRARVEGSGVVTVVEPSVARRSDPVTGQQVVLDATVRIDAAGSGQLRGTVEAVNDADEVQYGRTDAVSVLATDSEVLTGRAGLLQLRLDHLDHQRAVGIVGDADYARLRDEILGGGATTAP